MTLIDELKRRNVFRVAIAYLVASWLLLQIVDVLGGILDLPGSMGKVILVMLAVGLVPALIFSWAYEMTPEGLKRDSEVVANQSISHYTAKKLDRITIVLLLIVAGFVVIDRFIPEAVDRPAALVTETEKADRPIVSADNRPSVAVIPFVNMSDDEANEYFSDGISEELLNVLVRVRSLRIPSRTSSFTYKGSNKKLSVIGDELGVDHVLEGSVRKAGNRIRVTAQLIEVKTDTHVWSETYTRELDDIFAVQDEIAKAIVDALQLTLSSTDQERLGTHSTTNVQAYNEYLIGRHLWEKRSAQSLTAAIEHFKAAIAIDPQYDEAWVALAETYIVMPEYYAGSYEETTPLAREAVNNALAINPDSARALVVIASIKGYVDYDWEGSNAAYERAIELAPGYAPAHQWYGESLNIQGRIDEALYQLQLARKADPVSAVVRHVPGYVLLWALRLEEAEVHYRDVLDLGGQPFRWTLQNLDILNTLKGDYDEARRRARQLAEMEGYDPAADLARIDAVENPALKDRALVLLEQRQDMDDTVFGKALQYALLGEYESALTSLETGFAAGDAFATAMGYMRVYDPIRENPRFQAMLKEMNLHRN